MELLDDPYNPLRPARRTQWLVSALAHHYGMDQGLENEIIVLATGLDQYLQEVFHHLDWQGEGTISREDFHTLCRVLELEPAIEECEELLDDLPERLTFRHFHARLCGYFSSKAGGPRLPMGLESEHIQAQIRLRSPLRRRKTPRMSGRSEAEDELQTLEDENHSLRELVEDMRAALQSSDARCLALQVGLHRSHASERMDDISTISNRQVLSQSYTVTTREVNLIQCSRDEQMEEVIQMNRDLEEELSKTEKVLVYLEESNQRLIREQAEMRRKVEDVQQAVLACYGKVKDLEKKSSKVPALQIHIDQLETELQYYRSEKMTVHLATQEQKILSLRPYHVLVKSGPRSPTEDVDNVHNVEDQMFRSVEGQAASDEEEEKWAGDPEAELQWSLSRVSCCASECEDKKIRRLLSDVDHRDMSVLLVERITRLTEELTVKEQEMRDLEMMMEEMKEPFIEELERKDEEIELLRIDLQMLETERVRLSLIEEKLLDVLQLLQQLRDLEIPRQELGRVLLNTLAMSSEAQHGTEHVFEVLDMLQHELSVCELLQRQHEKKSNKGQSLANSLAISC
ncbi:EF-hand and coiled-coil domain-containing protein 1 [Pseudophryne corroboree]|uniref:EF-hand and coiled-coil domain-containing protein 1 n=1 Tax=Pseudophryne corroboree TaxID=495146 RepID=UPI003081BF10